MLIKRGVILRLDWMLITKHHYKIFILYLRFGGDGERTDMYKHVNTFSETMI